MNISKWMMSIRYYLIIEIKSPLRIHKCS